MILMSVSLKANAAAPENLYLLGAISKTDIAPEGTYDWNGLKFKKEGNVYKLNNVHFFPSFGVVSEFMISLANGSLENTKGKTFGSDKAPEKVDGVYTIDLKRNTDTYVTLRIEPGVYNLTLDYKPATTSANDTAVLKIEEAAPAAPDDLYLLGAISKTSASPEGTYDWTGLKFEKEGNVYKLNNVHFFPSLGTQSEFMISLANGSYGNTSGQTFAATVVPEKINGTYSIDLKRNIGDPSALKIEPGTYNLTLDYKPGSTSANDTAILKIEDAKGVETSVVSVTACSEIPVEYFSLSGAKIAKPTKGGVYICRQGDRVWKAVIK